MLHKANIRHPHFIVWNSHFYTLLSKVIYAPFRNPMCVQLKHVRIIMSWQIFFFLELRVFVWGFVCLQIIIFAYLNMQNNWR